MTNGKHIILDLDHTCINAFGIEVLTNLKLYSKVDQKNIKNRFGIINIIDATESDTVGDGHLLQCCFLMRKHLKEFLDFCVTNFDSVSIWSAGRYKYVHYIKEYILPDNDIAIFTFDDTEFLRNKKTGDIEKTIKDIKKMFPHLKGATEKNTIILDDTEETFSRNVKNGILCPAYYPDGDLKSILSEDDTLLQLISFFKLKKFKECNDVRKLDKCCIFTTTLNRYDELLKKEK